MKMPNPVQGWQISNERYVKEKRWNMVSSGSVPLSVTMKISGQVCPYLSGLQS